MATEARKIAEGAANIKAALAVNRNAVNAITRSICDGLKQVSGTGSLLTQVCKLAHTFYRGKAIPDADVTAMLDELSDRNGWKGASASIRRSEYKSVLRAYESLGEYMAAFLKRAGYCSWHDGISLARLVNKKTPITRAVSSLLTRSKAKKDPATRGDAKKLAAKSIKRVLNLKHIEKGFLEQLRSLCSEYGIRV